jgi:hypothetical protein
LSGIRRFMLAGGGVVVMDWGCGDAITANALQLFHRLLKSGGILLRGDIIVPDTPLIGHVTFLRFAWQNGFFVAALNGLARDILPPYRKPRRSAGYACYTQTQKLGLPDDIGFAGGQLASNIAVSQHRSSQSCAQIECRRCILAR